VPDATPPNPGPYLFAPDILAEGRGLSAGVCVAFLLLGAFLWLWGGRTHRFWISAGATLVAGWVGVTLGPTWGMQPLVAGLLLAVTAGALSLSLARLVVFAVGGLIAHTLCQQIAPGWEPVACFLAGGLGCILLYRFCITALASLAGTLLLGYGALWLADGQGLLDAVAWTGHNAPLLNWACLVVVVMGILSQYLLERRRSRKAGGKDKAGKAPDDIPAVIEFPEDEDEPPPKKPWWKRLSLGGFKFQWPLRKVA
jgi:hypothetical protein